MLMPLKKKLSQDKESFELNKPNHYLNEKKVKNSFINDMNNLLNNRWQKYLELALAIYPKLATFNTILPFY